MYDEYFGRHTRFSFQVLPRLVFKNETGCGLFTTIVAAIHPPKNLFLIKNLGSADFAILQKQTDYKSKHCLNN